MKVYKFILVLLLSTYFSLNISYGSTTTTVDQALYDLTLFLFPYYIGVVLLSYVGFYSKKLFSYIVLALLIGITFFSILVAQEEAWFMLIYAGPAIIYLLIISILLLKKKSMKYIHMLNILFVVLLIVIIGLLKPPL